MLLVIVGISSEFWWCGNVCVYMCNNVPVIPSDFTELSSHPGSSSLYTRRSHTGTPRHCTADHCTHYIESRTTRRVSFYKRLDGQTSTRCSGRCTGCLLNTESTISWPCGRSRLRRRHLRSIWTSTCRCAPAHATLDCRPSHCCACHFDGHHLPEDRSVLPHLWLGTHCHLLY